MAEDPEVPLDETVPMEQYKKLQRDLEKARGQAREAALQRFDVDELKAGQADLEKLVRAGTAGADDESVQELDVQRSARQKASEARAKLADISIEHGVDWSDPQLEEARKHYDAGEFEAAVSSAESAFASGSSIDPESPEFKAAVQAVIRENATVDQGTSTTSSGIPTDPDALKAKLADPAWFKEHKKEVMDLLRTGQI